MHHINVEFGDDPGAPWRKALKGFGMDEGFMKAFAAVAEPGDLPARVVEVQRGRYTAMGAGPDLGEEAKEIEAQPSGRLSFDAASSLDMPAVGDWVVLRVSKEGPASVKAILPRRGAFVRKAPGDTGHDRVEAQVLAANIDAAFIVMAAGRDWNPRRLERYLALAWESGAEPVVVIAKADLAEDPEALLAETESIAIGAACVLVCAPEGRGLDQLSSWMGAGRTIVLLGSSGAGKSTLLNALAGRELARTSEVRADDQRGRHTTTHRQLYRLPNGALVIDTPGMRELQLWAEEGDVARAFPDIEALAESCRFRDCMHEREPGCAVRAALESGELDGGRHESWRKLMREVAFLRLREDRAAREAERQRWKSITKSMRDYSKERRSAAGSSR